MKASGRELDRRVVTAALETMIDRQLVQDRMDPDRCDVPRRVFKLTALGEATLAS